MSTNHDGRSPANRSINSYYSKRLRSGNVESQRALEEGRWRHRHDPHLRGSRHVCLPRCACSVWHRCRARKGELRQSIPWYVLVHERPEQTSIASAVLHMMRNTHLFRDGSRIFIDKWGTIFRLGNDACSALKVAIMSLWSSCPIASICSPSELDDMSGSDKAPRPSLERVI